MLAPVVVALALLLQPLRALVAQLGWWLYRPSARLARRLVLLVLAPLLRLPVPPRPRYLLSAHLQRRDEQHWLAHRPPAQAFPQEIERLGAQVAALVRPLVAFALAVLLLAVSLGLVTCERVSEGPKGGVPPAATKQSLAQMTRVWPEQLQSLLHKDRTRHRELIEPSLH